MMWKKRGLVLVLVLVLLAVSVYGEELKVNQIKYISLGTVWNDDYGRCNDEDVVIAYTNDKLRPYARQCTFDNTDFSSLGSENEPRCYLNNVDYDGANTNDCGKLSILYGVQIDVIPYDMDEGAGEMLYETDGDGVENSYCKNWYTKGPAYICSSDHYWHECSASGEKDDSEEGKIVWIFNESYQCIFDKSKQMAQWIKRGIDQDQDGYTTTQGDYYDNPSNDPTNIDCPVRDENGDLDCQYPQHSLCAACINPGAPETCGDGIDNDNNPDTSDNCNNFAAGCENVEYNTFTTDGEEKTQIGYNIYGESFAWVGDESTGMCCGFGGVANDLGKIYNDNNNNNYLCLNQKESLVYPQMCDSSNSKWCLLIADSDINDFTPITIKKPGEKTYDVLSNNKNWINCDEENLGGLTTTNIAKQKEANQFQCYDAGTFYAWVSCVPEENYQSTDIKSRGPGDGLLNINLPEISATGEDIISIDLTDSYGKYYQDVRENSAKSLFSILDKDYLEFYLQFPNKLQFFPVEVLMYIYGPEQENSPVIYFNKNILGYAVNSPILKPQSWIHIKIPLDDLKSKGLYNLESISFQSTFPENKIKVRNLQFSSINDNLICSGQFSSSSDYDSWLTDLDLNEEGKITGEDVCNVLFDPEFDIGEENADKGNAWLGQDFGCCGNEADEYYSGESSNDYGCWNSVPLASGETIMNIEYTQNYRSPNLNFQYDPVRVSCTIQLSYFEPEHETIKDLREQINDALAINDSLKIYNLSYENQQYTSFQLNCQDDENYNAFFYNSRTGENLGSQVSPRDYYTPEEIKVAISSNLVHTSVEEENQEETFTYVCDNPEGCLYPLKGLPPYKVTNLHPELYEMYYVIGSDPEDFLPIGNFRIYDGQANLMVRDVSQQVIYVNQFDEESGESLQGFFGCNAYDNLQEYLENLDYCSIKADKFCAPSVTKINPEENNEWGYTVINSWTDEALDWIGYSTIDFPKGEDLNTYYENAVLSLKDISENPLLAKERTHFSFPLPARNLISNAEFKIYRDQLPNWKIFVNQFGQYNLKANEKENVFKNEAGDNYLQLNQDEKLISEKIVLLKDQEYSFSSESTCNTNIYLYDQQGNENLLTNNPTSFNSEDYAYVLLEFISTGQSCLVQKPMLQFVTSLDPITYYYNSQHELKNDFDSRSGAACCAEDSCWNGYACVEDMSENTYLVEHLPDGRNYRCIKGIWEPLGEKKDWNNQVWGFCEEESQCFVMNSESGNKENTATDFYLGKSPLCIDQNEYIFDHFCEDGNWSSRTKKLAEILISMAGTQDYVLYCTNYHDAFLEYENEDYVGGKLTRTGSESENFLAGDTPYLLKYCFNEVENNGESNRLVPTEENTCINNVCVLKLSNGDVAFATSLNENISGPNSFLYSLGTPSSDVISNGEICNQDAEGFQKCNDLNDYNIEAQNNLWYSKELNSVIYGDIPVSSLWRDLLDFFQGLFSGSSLSEDENFVSEAKNFRELYLAKQDGRNIRALLEIFPGNEKGLAAEYAGFSTSVCDYAQAVDNRLFNSGELLELESGDKNLICNVSENKEKIHAFSSPAGLKYLWPQLTSELRLQ